MVKVKISEKGGQQSNYEFDKPEVTIGRMKGNDIVLPKGNVSKKHARIYRQNGVLLIDDLDSTNGTYVNGRKVDSDHEISGNDKIYIGDFILQVTADQQPQTGGPPQNPPEPPSGSEAERRNSQKQRSAPPQSNPGGGAGPADPPGQTNPPGTGAGPSDPPGQTNPPGGSQSDTPPPAGQQPGPSGNNQNNPPPSPPDSGGDDGDPLSSLDEKYGSGGGSAAGASRSSPEQDGGSRGVGGDNSRPRNSTPRSESSRGPAQNDSSARSTRRGQQEEVRTGGGPSTPAGGDQPNDSGESNPGRAQSAPPDRSPPSTGDSPVSEADPKPPTPESDSGRQEKVSQEREAADLRSDRSDGGAAEKPVVAPDLESEFDEDFRDAQREVVETLLQQFALDDLPLTYPPEQADREEFQKIVRDTVREVKPRRVDREQLIEVFTDECVGLGPLETYLDDPNVQNIYVNQHDRIVLRRDNDVVVGRYAFSHPDFLRVATWRLLGTRDPEVITDEVRFGDGTRVQVTLPPVSVDGPVLTVRKPPTDHPSIDDLVADGVMSSGMGTFLERAVETGRSVLVAGPVSSGKTTLLEALARGIPDSSRTIVVEENTQLELPQEGVVRLESRPGAGYDLEQLLDAAVEMHPEKIILDECRGPEAYTWVSSAASGTDGSMATLHGIDASDALGRLESLCLLGSGDISPRGLREQIARAVDLVVIINRGNDGNFRVQQVTEVQGVDLDTFRLNDVFYYQVDGSSGAFHPTGYVPLFYEDLRHLGMDVDLEIFRE